MKVLTVFLAIIFMAATSEAQRGGGFHGGGGFHRGAPMANPGFGVHPGFGLGPRINPTFGPGFHPAFRGGVWPFFGFPSYAVGPVVPLDSEQIYSAPTYVAPDQTLTTNGFQTNDDLRAQVQQLTNEVQQFRAQLEVKRGQLPETCAPAPRTPPSEILLLKDGRWIPVTH